jgi:hypothetical protein
MGERADGLTGLIVNENGRIPQAETTFRHYESVLYAFYNRELTIDSSDVPSALQDCDDLLQISDYLGCTSLFCKPIEVALFKHGQALFPWIQKAPHLYIEFASRIRSEIMFRECMIHLVGNWGVIKNNPQVSKRIRLLPGLRALIEKYHRALLKKGEKLELAIMAQYPGGIATPSEDLPIKREAYARDILIWMALTFFRHWLTQRLLLNKGRHAPDSGYELYKQLSVGGEEYMDRTVMVQFHSKFPMTKKALNVLSAHVTEIKSFVAKMVQEHGILGSECALDLQRFPVQYLTCTEFKTEDLPWLKEAAVPAVPAKREYEPGGNDIARENLEAAKKFQAKSASMSESRGEESEEDDDD